MYEDLASIRLHADLHDHLRVLAAELSQQRRVRITILSLLEEGIRAVCTQPLEAWVAWAAQDSNTVRIGEASISFRIHAELVRDLGVLAAHVTAQSKVPITKTHLIEEAGRRIIAQIEAEQRELDAMAHEAETIDT